MSLLSSSPSLGSFPHYYSTGFKYASLFTVHPYAKLYAYIKNAHRERERERENICSMKLTSTQRARCFSDDQPMYWREASHGLNRGAFFCARALAGSSGRV